jgi:hypothetical protein
VFNSIQVTNYWFTLHCALRPLYQQAQTFSPNIWGISDQDVTLWTFLQYKNDNQCTEVSFDKLSQPSRSSANDWCTQGTDTQCIHRWEGSCEPSWSSLSYILNSIRQSSGLRWTKVCLLYHISRMQHSIELTSNCMSSLTRHQRNEWTIRNPYSATIRSSRMSFEEPLRYWWETSSRKMTSHSKDE